MNAIGNNYEYFLSIAELQSITKAADKNYISQPSMTQYLNRLERSAGAQLFNRGNGSLTLTLAGELYMQYVRKILELNASWQKDLARIATIINGAITMGIPMQMQPLIYPKILEPFLVKQPQIKVKINDGASEELEKDVLRGRLDAALIYVHEKKHKTLSYCTLEQEPLLLVCSRNSPLIRGQECSIQHPGEIHRTELQDQTVFLLPSEFTIHQYATDLLKNIGTMPGQIITMSNINAILSAVAENRGIAFIPKYSYQLYRHPEKLAVLFLAEAAPVNMNISLVYKQTKHMPSAIQEFVNFIIKKYAVSA